MHSPLIAAVWLASSAPAAITPENIEPVALDQHALAQDTLAQLALAPDEVFAVPATFAFAQKEPAPQETGGTSSPQLDPQSDDTPATNEPEGPDENSPAAVADGNTIVVTGAADAIGKDPLSAMNEVSFELTQEVDEALVGPIANAYEDGLPRPVRKGLRNFFRNLLEPVNFLNYLLQFKPGKAFETLGRFAINSTVGIAGFIDVAERKPFNLPYRRNGFSNTLGYYGVGHGPFLFVPLVGATTLRDLIGSFLDQSVLPLAVGAPFNTPYYAIPAYTVNSLEFRIEFDEKLTEIRETDDPYFAARESYLCNREADIAALKNRPPPRDCSIEALMSEGAPLIAAGADLTDQDLGSAVEQVTGAAQPVDAAAPEPIEPEIRYISEEVVQPLPQA